MKGLSGICITVCLVSIAVCIFSVLIPQKRTAKIMSFVIGLFLTAAILSSIIAKSEEISLDISELEKYKLPEYSQDDYNDTAIQMTADNLTSALNELLKNEGINADDIKLTLKITDEGRIYASRVVIYINEEDYLRRSDIKSIIYRNLSKEPEIYVTGQENERSAQ